MWYHLLRVAERERVETVIKREGEVNGREMRERGEPEKWD
jgi:hypothetical protein